jgi:hypothetical protein
MAEKNVERAEVGAVGARLDTKLSRARVCRRGAKLFSKRVDSMKGREGHWPMSTFAGKCVDCFTLHSQTLLA